MSSPFERVTVVRLEKISYLFLGMWLLGIAGNGYTKWLAKSVGEWAGPFVTGESLFVAGIVFIVSQVFKRGVEIQSENELTV